MRRSSACSTGLAVNDRHRCPRCRTLRSARSDVADALLWNHPKGAKFQTRQCGPNPLQALQVTPLLYAGEARLALTATQIVVLDQAPESVCEAVDIPGRRRVAVDTVLD